MNRIICGGDQITSDEGNEALITAEDTLLVIEDPENLRVTNEMTIGSCRDPTGRTRCPPVDPHEGRTNHGDSLRRN
jgi:hypothetical protein